MIKAPCCDLTSVRTRMEGYIAHYVTHKDYAPGLVEPWVIRVTMPVCMEGCPSLAVTIRNGLNYCTAFGSQ